MLAKSSSLNAVLRSSVQTSTSSRLLLVPSTASQRVLLSTRCSSSGRVDPPNVKEIAKMAHVAVTDEEVKEWGPKIQGIVEWFGQLQQVNVEGVPPALRAAGQESEEHALRPDAPVAYSQRPQLLEQAPAREGAFLKLPKILATDQE